MVAALRGETRRVGENDRVEVAADRHVVGAALRCVAQLVKREQCDAACLLLDHHAAALRYLYLCTRALLLPLRKLLPELVQFAARVRVQRVQERLEEHGLPLPVVCAVEAAS